MKTHTYPTNLTDTEWAKLEPLFPVVRTGHPRHHRLRTIVNALLYVLHTGCAWRLLPSDWPAWQSVYYYLRKVRRDGTLERIHPSCARTCGLRWVGIHSPARAVSTVNR